MGKEMRNTFVMIFLALCAMMFGAAHPYRLSMIKLSSMKPKASLLLLKEKPTSIFTEMVGLVAVLTSIYFSMEILG